MRAISSYGRVRRCIGLVLRNRAWLQRPPRCDYLNVGCGPNVRPGFVNLDSEWVPGIDLCWDATTRLPFADGALSGIFSEHFLEHLPFEAADGVLREMRRVLRPGGVLRLVVPDGELYLKNYASGAPIPYAEEDPRDGLYSPMMSVNRIFRSHGHRFIYDFDTLSQLLQRQGFGEVRRERFMQGRDPHLLIDMEWRAVESLYVEASVGAGQLGWR